MPGRNPIKEAIEILKIRSGRTGEEIAKTAGIPFGTFRYRLSNPDTFRLGELRKLDRECRKFDLSLWEGMR